MQAIQIAVAFSLSILTGFGVVASNPLVGFIAFFAGLGLQLSFLWEAGRYTGVRRAMVSAEVVATYLWLGSPHVAQALFSWFGWEATPNQVGALLMLALAVINFVEYLVQSRGRQEAPPAEVAPVAGEFPEESPEGEEGEEEEENDAD